MKKHQLFKDALMSKIYGLLVVIFSWINIWRLFKIPSEGGPLFGYSFNRLSLAALLILFFCAGVLLFLLSTRFHPLIKKLEDYLSSSQGHFNLIYFINTTLFAISGLLAVTPANQTDRFHYYYERLLPLFSFFCCWFLLNSLTLIVYQIKNDPTGWKSFKAIFNRDRSGFLKIFLILGGFILFALITGLGFKNDGFFWNVPGIPLRLCETAILVFVSFWLIWWRKDDFRRPISRFSRLDLFLFAVIFLATAVAWVITPLPASFFAPGPDLPNNEFYPFSDAAYYDTDAQLARIGQGMGNGEEVDKPIYSSFVYVTHLIAGWDEYQSVFAVHAALLAVGSGLIYLIGSAIHSRTTGIVAGISTVMLGRNMILSAALAISANPKLLLTGYFAGVILMLLCLLLIRWVQSPGEMQWVIYIGAVLGLSVYSRHNFWFVIPFVVLAFGYMYWRKPKLNVIPLLVLAVSFLIVFLPWFIRDISNGVSQSLDERIAYRVLARFGYTPSPRLISPVDQHGFEKELKQVIFRWRGYPSDVAYVLMVEKGDSEFITQQFTPDQICNLKFEKCEVSVAADWERSEYRWTVTSENIHHKMRQSDQFEFAIDPDVVPNSSTSRLYPILGAVMIPSSIPGISKDQPETVWDTVVIPIGNHFMHNIVTGLLSLPMQSSNLNLETMLRGEHSLWVEGSDINLTVSQWFLLIINLAILSAGCIAIFRKTSWTGFIPAALLLAYDIGLAIPRTSGGRYISAIQWIFWLYWIIGIVAICMWFITIFHHRNDTSEPLQVKFQSEKGNFIYWRWRWLPAVVVLMLAGGFPVMIDQLIPQHYEDLSNDSMIDLFSQSAASLGVNIPDNFEEILESNPSMEIQQGKLLYPRFYWAMEGRELQQSAYGKLDYDRLIFTVAGVNGITYGILPVSDGRIPVAPQDADVIFIGCANQQGYFQVLSMLVETEEQSWYYGIQNDDEWSCGEP